MALTEIDICAQPDAVYAVLADPETYPVWLVGAKQIRGIDPEFPRPGSGFRHKVGAGPVEVKDETKSLEARPGERLVLQAKARPLGQARVVFNLHPTPNGTRVEMAERVVDPAVLRWLDPVMAPLIKARNKASLTNLKQLVEG